MNTSTTTRRHHDRGASLVEILVTVFLLAVVGALITGTVIAGMKSTRSTQSGVEGQSELNDALSRIARDISVADPILATTTTWGSSTATPAATEIWTQSVTQYKCVRTRYYLDTSGSTKALKSATQVFSGETCPDPSEHVTTPTPTVKTIIRDFKDTDTTGATVPLFTYYDKANNPIAAPVARANVTKIARVKIDVGSNVRERAQGVRLSTSAAPRSLDGSLVTGVPAPICISYAATNGTAAIVGADLTTAITADYVPTPIVSWKNADYTDLYVLRRRNTNGTWTTIPNATSPYTDTAMRGHHSRAIAYELDITGPGGTATCGITVPAIANKAPAAPQATITVTPDTNAGPTTSNFTSSTISINWAAVPEAERYDIYRRAIDSNNAPFNSSTTWPVYPAAPHASVTGTSYTTTITFDTAYEWMVRAVDTDWTDPNGVVGTPSADSNTGKTLAHNESPLIQNIVTSNGTRDPLNGQTGPATHGENRITWAAASGTTIGGYRVWKRVTGTTPWQFASSNLPSSARTYLDTGVPLGSEYDYVVTAYNQGPRGTGATNPHAYTSGAGTIYYGRYSNIATILQYPADPTYYARGTENSHAYNPDGRNSVHWNAVPGATWYKVDEYHTLASTAGGTMLSTTTQATDLFDTTHTERGSRQFYVVEANNVTGWSPNAYNLNLRPPQAAIAYQRPNTPPASWNKSPDLNVDATNGNAVTFNYTRNADDGETSGDKYCSTASLCTYHAYKGAALVETETGNTGDALLGKSGEPGGTEWGTSDTFHLYSCNPGGCSGANSIAANYYPGPFTHWVGNLDGYRHVYQWGKGGTFTESAAGDSGANYNWSRSIGASSWAINRTPVADDPFNYAGSAWYNSTANNQYSPGWTRADTTNAVAGGQNQALGLRPWGTAGSVQQFAISAIAPNGLSRFSAFNYQMKAASAKFIESTRSCNTNQPTVWRVAGRMMPQAAVYDSVTGTLRNSVADNFHITTYATRRSGNATQLGAALTQGAANLEYVNVSTALKGSSSASGGGSFGDGAWNIDGNQDEYWMHQNIANRTGSAEYLAGIVSDSSNTWNVPRESGVGAAFRVTPFVSAVGPHAVGVGDFDGITTTVNEFVVNDQSFACTTSTWQPTVDSISRVAVPGGGSAITPASGAGRSFSLSGN